MTTSCGGDKFGYKYYFELLADSLIIVPSLYTLNKVVLPDNRAPLFKLIAAEGIMLVLGGVSAYYLTNNFFAQKAILKPISMSIVASVYTALTDNLPNNKVNKIFSASLVSMAMFDSILKLTCPSCYDKSLAVTYTFSLFNSAPSLALAAYSSGAFAEYYNVQGKCLYLIIEGIIHGMTVYLIAPPTMDLYTHSDYNDITSFDIILAASTVLIQGISFRVGISLIGKNGVVYPTAESVHGILLPTLKFTGAFLPGHIFTTFVTPLLQDLLKTKNEDISNDSTFTIGIISDASYDAVIALQKEISYSIKEKFGVLSYKHYPKVIIDNSILDKQLAINYLEKINDLKYLGASIVIVAGNNFDVIRSKIIIEPPIPVINLGESV